MRGKITKESQGQRKKKKTSNIYSLQILEMDDHVIQAQL